MSTWPPSPAIVMTPTHSKIRPSALKSWRNGQRGLSLAELMVALTIGMLTILAITQTVTFFDSQRRGTTTGADAQSNGNLATYLIERDLRQAGYGSFAMDTALIKRCSLGSVLAYNSERSPQDIEFSNLGVPFAPVSINPPGIPAGDPNTDVIGVAYGVSAIGLSGKGVEILADKAPTAYSIRNTTGFVAGDLVLAVPDINIDAACSIYEVTDGPSTVNCSGSGTTSDLMHGSASYSNRYKDCAQISPTRNKPGGLGITYVGGNLFNLGSRDNLVAAFYAVRNGQLTRCDHFQTDCSNDGKTGDTTVWVPIASGIASLRAEFGIASGGLKAPIDTWRTNVCAEPDCQFSRPAPNNNEWQNLRAIRIAVVARSQAPGSTSTAPPHWGGQTDIILGDEWQKYRYSTTEVIVPLRNIVWGATS